MVNLLTGPKGSGKTQQMIEQANKQAKECRGNVVFIKKTHRDTASVAFDTLSSAKANGADVVLIDTAGRLHNKVGLMNELKKIKDVMKKGHSSGSG
mgnify:CR=1 FL=1